MKEGDFSPHSPSGLRFCIEFPALVPIPGMVYIVKRPRRLYSPRGTYKTFLLKHTLNTRACVHQHTVFKRVTINNNNNNNNNVLLLHHPPC